METKNGINPATIPSISYCKKHEYFINLHPNIKATFDNEYYVVCPDCGSSNMNRNLKTIFEAVADWNRHYGISKT
jgi:hypothetical protein